MPTVFVILIVVLIAAAVAYWWFFMKKKEKPTNQVNLSESPGDGEETVVGAPMQDAGDAPEQGAPPAKEEKDKGPEGPAAPPPSAA